MKRLVWTLYAIGIALLIASLFPTTESMLWVPLLAGSFVFIASSCITALIVTRKKPLSEFRHNERGK